MNRTLKDIINIKIDQESFICFVLSDNSKYIAASICKFFSSNTDLEPLELAEIKKDNRTKVFPLDIVINNLRPRLLKELAIEGLSDRIDKAINNKNNPKGRILSEFDKMMLKAINYNPKKNK